MKTETIRALIAGAIILGLVALALLGSTATGATAPDTSAAVPQNKSLRHTTMTMCGMLVLYMVDFEGEWMQGYVGTDLVRITDQLNKWKTEGKLTTNTELAVHYPPVYRSCETLHEAQLEWARDRGLNEEYIIELEGALKHWREVFRPPE